MNDIDEKPAPSAALRVFTAALVVVAAAAIGLTILIARASFRGANSSDVVGPGDLAPPVTAAGWLNGNPPDSDLSGRVTFVHGWYTTCPHCRRRVPSLKELYDRYHSRGVDFIGLTFEDDGQFRQIEDFVRGTGMTWLNGFGAQETLDEFGATGYPCAWVVGPDGRILWDSVGGGDPAGAIEHGLEAAKAATE